SRRRHASAGARRRGARDFAPRAGTGRSRELGAAVRASRRSAGAVGGDARTSAREFMTAVTVLPATEGALDRVLAIERAAFTDPWSREAFREALTHDAVFFATAHREESVDGYVVAWFVADQGEIANLAVAPDGWGQGIGKTLLDAAIAAGRARGATSIFL